MAAPVSSPVDVAARETASSSRNLASTSQRQQHGAPPYTGVAQVAAPKIELQPWAKRSLKWLGNNTTGVARVDLRRPTLPPQEQYEGNIFLARKPKPNTWDGPGSEPQDNQFGLQVPRSTGARIKITRNVMLFKHPEGKRKPLIDFGIGVSVDMDRGRVEPVARVKIADLVSVKTFPGLVKLSKSFSLGSTGMSAKVLYELPLSNIQGFWRPPARLMVRLDNAVGSGLHLSPNGIEFDEKMVHFGSNLAIRAGFGFRFPRSLPIDWESGDVGFKVHRLSLKSAW